METSWRERRRVRCMQQVILEGKDEKGKCKCGLREICTSNVLCVCLCMCIDLPHQKAQISVNL